MGETEAYEVIGKDLPKQDGRVVFLPYSKIEKHDDFFLAFQLQVARDLCIHYIQMYSKSIDIYSVSHDCTSINSIMNGID